MKLISAAITKDQIRASMALVRRGKPPVKDVTRRLGWNNLKPGERLQVVEKGQGIPKGGKVVRICVIEVVSVRRERLNRMKNGRAYGEEEVEREGFGLTHTPESFVKMFCLHNGCRPSTKVTRIEFKYV